MKKHFDISSIVVILITFILFFVALFVKGLSHDILLETGVLLVSVKLILSNYKSSVNVNRIMSELSEIKEILKSKQ